NESDCTLSEVEGDALLFYRKGEAIPRETMIRQCLDMFHAFHTRLKLIERDSICQCGACQTATNLTLKFIVHYGPIKEIRVSRFVKASGLDMIIAHRLLKNGIPSDEYILTTQRYLDVLSNRNADGDLEWLSSSETYPAIGQLEYQYALLQNIKSGIDDPPLPESLAYTVGPARIAVDVKLPMMDVYELLIDLENRIHWIPGLRNSRSEHAVDRLGSRHLCVFDDDTYEVVPSEHDIGKDKIRYVELNTGLKSGLIYPTEFLLTPAEGQSTHVEMVIGEVPESPIEEEIMKLVLHEWRHIAESFKVFCESAS
ncbi:MAG: DUF2652 domain-containing protein, partial [Saprospiraceae bacterium]|nr:DUF2652 domain-containing protein [Saprospiraceae bacterium]